MVESNYTTLSAKRETIERFHTKKDIVAEDAQVDVGTDRFLEMLLDHWEDGESWIGEPRVVPVSELDRSVEFPTADVKEAMRKVLREELEDLYR